MVHNACHLMVEIVNVERVGWMQLHAYLGCRLQVVWLIGTFHTPNRSSLQLILVVVRFDLGGAIQQRAIPQRQSAFCRITVSSSWLRRESDQCMNILTNNQVRPRLFVLL